MDLVVEKVSLIVGGAASLAASVLAHAAGLGGTPWAIFFTACAAVGVACGTILVVVLTLEEVVRAMIRVRALVGRRPASGGLDPHEDEHVPPISLVATCYR